MDRLTANDPLASGPVHTPESRQSPARSSVGRHNSSHTIKCVHRVWHDLHVFIGVCSRFCQSCKDLSEHGRAQRQLQRPAHLKRLTGVLVAGARRGPVQCRACPLLLHNTSDGSAVYNLTSNNGTHLQVQGTNVSEDSNYLVDKN